MPAELIFNNINNQFSIPKKLLPDNGVALSHHFQSTEADNLIELCCRISYISTKSDKSRGSKELHQHINEANHSSTQQHFRFTLSLSIDKGNLASAYECFLNKPGFYIITENGDDNNSVILRITGNIRAIREWYRVESKPNNPMFDYIGYCLQSYARLFAPLAANHVDSQQLYKYAGVPSSPKYPQEKIYSFYIYDISRANSLELIRHGHNVGISQRSSRYCDESESSWSWHPLIKKYWKEINESLIDPLYNPRAYAENPAQIESDAKSMYYKIVDFLENKLVDNGESKTLARKAARGAARGVLGNALSTELVFTANLSMWNNIILQRCNPHADAEIRLLCNDIFNILHEREPEFFANYKTRPCKDGFGFEVYFE